MKYVLIFLLLIAPAFGQDAAKKVDPPAVPAPAAPASVGAPLAAPPIVKPVPVDADFTELYGDYALLLQEINRIETATGQVTITLPLTELRRRALAKEKKMQAWVDAHKVGRGWILDWQKKQFQPPEAAIQAQGNKPAKEEAKARPPAAEGQK